MQNSWYLIPVKVSFNPQWGHDPQFETDQIKVFTLL